LDDLVNLASQFNLLNLPNHRPTLERKIETSLASFAGQRSKETSEYTLVAEDVDNKFVVGCATIVGKKGVPESPNYSFRVLKKERFSRDLGVGFIHQILRLKVDTDGSSEVGGLVIDRGYRRRPEKLGKLISLSRFCYIGLKPERFTESVHVEMAPPLTEDGKSEFWEALGRRFTGMPYQEADALSQQNKEFIRSLFPEEDIYLCLLDAKARLVVGRVGPETQPALHMLEGLGFKYKEEIDPFDGGPHLGCPARDIKVIREGRVLEFDPGLSSEFGDEALVGVEWVEGFRGGRTFCRVEGSKVSFPPKSVERLELEKGDAVFVYLMD
jgi:arginine N-succinyltransferase